MTILLRTPPLILAEHFASLFPKSNHHYLKVATPATTKQLNVTPYSVACKGYDLLMEKILYLLMEIQKFPLCFSTQSVRGIKTLLIDRQTAGGALHPQNFINLLPMLLQRIFV